MADGKVIIDTELNDKGLEQGLANMQSKMEGLGNSMKDTGGKLTKGLTLPIVAAGTGAVMLAAKFDDSMRTVKATMGKNLGGSTKEANANFKLLRDEAMKLGATTAHSASDASGAMKEFAQMGYDTNQILSATGPALDVASASGLELDFVAATLAGSMNQFGVEVDDNGVNVTRFGDVMVRAGQMSGTSMEEIGKALEYVGSGAHNAGMDIEQTSAFIGVLGDQSIKGGKAGTALNAMLTDMKSKAKDGNLEFGEFEVALYDANGEMRDMTDVMVDIEAGMEGMSDAEKDAAKNKIFGVQSQSALNAILGEGTDKLKEYEKDLRSADGAAKNAAEEMEGGIGGAFRALGSATEALGISFGNVLAPHIHKLADFVADLFLKFTELSDGMKKKIVVIGLVLAAIGPLLVILGTIIGVIAKVAGAFALITPPIMIAIGVIALIIAIGVLLYKNWDKIKEKAKDVFSQFAPLLDTVKEAFQKLKDSVGPILESLKTLWESLTPILTVLARLVGGILVVAFGLAISIFNGAIAAIGPLINAIINIADIVLNMANFVVALLVGDFAGAWDYLKDIGQSTKDFFVNIFTSLLDFIVSFIKTFIDFFHGLYMTLVGNSIIPDIVNEIVEWFKNMVTWVIDLVKKIVKGVVDGFTALWDGIVAIFTAILNFYIAVWTAIFNAIKSAVDKIKNVVTVVFNAVRTVITTVMNVIRTVISTIWNTIKSVITTVVNTIRSVITSVFNAIRSVISSVMNSIRSVITSIWNGIRSVITSVVNAIRSVVTSVFNAVRSTISSVMSSISSTVTRVWNAIKTTITNVTNSIKTTISTIFNSLKGIVSTAFTNVTSAVKTGIGNALTAITDKIKDFYNAGKNIIGAIADGIKDTVGKVTGAIGGVAKKIREFLPFSPAKEGPLRDLNKLDFGGPIEDSMNNAIPDVQAKMNALLNVPSIHADVPRTSSAKQDNRSDKLESLLQAQNRILGKILEKNPDIVLNGEKVADAVNDINAIKATVSQF